MKLKRFSDELLAKMKSQIELVTHEQQDVLLRTSQIISEIEVCVAELKQFVLEYKFESTHEEVEFFKTIKPIFISQLWFHKKLFKINLFESFNDMASCTDYYKKQLVEAKNFMIKNEEFYYYILSNSIHLDEKYFVKGNVAKRSVMEDERFSTGYDNKLSKILTYQLIKDYIVNAMQNCKKSTGSNDSKLSWTGSKTDLVELIYALHASKVFNEASLDLKELASQFEAFFNVSLGNYYRVFQDIRLRKVNQTKFIDNMKHGLLKKIDSFDS